MENEERDRLVCEAYLVKTVPAVAQEFGISVSLVEKIVKQYKIKRKSIVRADKVGNLGPLYVKLGLIVYMAREKRSEDRTRFAERLGWSAKKLASVEKGTFEVTMLDVVDIATISGKTNPQLWEEISKNDI